MKIQQIALLIMMVAVSFNSVAEKIYKTVDESGAVVFSDKKTSGAEKIKVQPNVTSVRVPVMPEPTPEKKAKQAAANASEVQREEVGRGTATAGNLKRKIRNVTNGEGIKRPVNLPARRPSIGGGGARGGGGR